jgi:hypothetical protein
MGGDSYRRKDGYGIPLDSAHAHYWSQSSLPIAGIVCDPEDGQLRWCNISDFLSSLGQNVPSYIPIVAERILNAETLESDFKRTFYAFNTQRVVGPALLQLASDDRDGQIRALQDCFALGRTDARVLILIRHLLHLFAPDVLRLALIILAHATPHPDIFWHRGNWIPLETCAELKKRLVWSPHEIEILMNSADQEEWHRGAFGQCVYSLLCEDPKIEQKMGDVAIAALAKGDEELAFWAMYLTIYWARREGPEMYSGFLAIDRRFGELSLSKEVQLALKENGYLVLFE